LKQESDLSVSDELYQHLKDLPHIQRVALTWRLDWLAKAHPFQILPNGDHWTVWLLLAGRGSGKTKCASNNIGWWAWDQPKTRGLVMAPTANDIRFTCFEGDSGLLNTIPTELIAKYNKSTFELELINGSHLRGISADSYERLRGPQFHYAWCDELAAYEYLQEAWDMMMFGLRLGQCPRVIATTTPKPKDLIWHLVKREGIDVIVDRASSYANLDNLAPTFKAQITQYEGTKLGRQEIHAEIIDPFEAGVIKKAWIKMWESSRALPTFDCIIYSLDTAFTEKTVPTKEERKRGTYEDRDPTACTVWGIFFNPATKRKEMLLLDCWDDYYGLPDLIERVKQESKIRYGANKVSTYVTSQHAKFGPHGRHVEDPDQTFGGRAPDIILIEEKGSGISLRQMLSREGIQTYPYNPNNADKLSRLHSVSHLFFHGIVWMPESEKEKGKFKSWTDECVKQLCSYAGEESIKHDDYCDSVSQALIYLADKNWLSMTVIPPDSGIVPKRKPTYNFYSQ
jgi:predicted phage terminase large subunit-like protein